MSSKGQIELDIETLRATVDEWQRRLREEEDPAELNEYRRAFKKLVPFFLRSYMAGYLLHQLAQKGGVRRKMSTTTLFLSIGKNRRVYPRDLIQLLFAAGKVSKAEVGDIKILDNYSFIEVNDKVAADVIGRLDGIVYRGRRLTANYAKKRAADEALGSSKDGAENPVEFDPQD